MRRARTRHVSVSAPSPRRKSLVKYITILGVIITLIICGVLFIPISLRMHLAVMDQSTGSVSVYSFDDRSAAVFVIPGDTVMTTSGNLGEWPAKSLWKLGHDEKQGGQLLERSIIKTFGVPVTNWANPKFVSSLNNGFFGFINILSMTDTNLSVLERVNLALASIRGVTVLSRNLEGTSALERVDDHGESRFLVRERLPVSFTTQFDDDDLSSTVPTVGILDGTESSLSAQWLVKLVNVVGGRVVSRDRTEWDGACEIYGKPAVTSYFAKILPCKVTKESAEPFDMTIKLGAKFTQTM